jgi:hypothetical protein
MFGKSDEKDLLKHEFKYPIGAEVRNKITGFEGIITSRVQYITGCDQYGLQPRVDEKGNHREGIYADEGQLEPVNEGIKEEEVQGKEKGGPQFHPDKI